MKYNFSNFVVRLFKKKKNIVPDNNELSYFELKRRNVRPNGVKRSKLMTWSYRHQKIHEKLCEIFKSNEIETVSVLNLGGGFVRRASPTTINLLRIFRKKGISIKNATVVDLIAQKILKNNVNYVTSDALNYVKSQNSKLPNLVINLRILEHLQPEKATELVQNIWQRIPEKGIWVTETHFLKVSGSTVIFPVIIQKINGKAKVFLDFVDLKGRTWGGESEYTIKERIRKAYNGQNVDNFMFRV
jgi:hypothetical protein